MFGPKTTSKLALLCLPALAGGCVPTANTGSPAAVGPAGSVTVDSKSDHWTHSGVTVETGQTYEIAATGRWSVAVYLPAYPPEGGENRHLIPGMPITPGVIPSRGPNTLIGKVGSTGVPFAIGQAYTLKPSVSGPLFLRINDGYGVTIDNSGTVNVTIRKKEVRRPAAAKPKPKPKPLRESWR